MRNILFTVTTLMIAGCSCSTLFSSKSVNNKTTTKSQSDGAIRTGAARVQPQWQSKFDAAVSEKGSGSEGWALFADSSMGHTGQQLVVRSPNNTYQICYAPAATNDCVFKDLDAAKWQAVVAAVNAGDALGDRTVQVFDALNMEYVHVVNNDGQLKTTARVFFMVDEKPLPATYDNLMNAFTGLPK